MRIEKIFDNTISSEQVPELKLSFKRSCITREKLESGEDYFKLLSTIFDPDTFDIKEEMVLLVFDSDNRLICYHRIGKGSEDEVPVDYRTLMTILLATHANHFVIAHNHPGGNPLPSGQDISFIHDVSLRTALFGIEFRDSIILGRLEEEGDGESPEFPPYYSLREHGFMYNVGFEY